MSQLRMGRGGVRRYVVATIVVGLLSAGCGDDGDSAAVTATTESPPALAPSNDVDPAAAAAKSPEGTVRALFAAAIARDGRTACALVTRRGRSLIDSPSIRGAGNKACVQNVETYTHGEIDIELIDVIPVSQAERTASVDVVLEQDGARDRSTLELIKAGGRWLADEEEGVEIK